MLTPAMPADSMPVEWPARMRTSSRSASAIIRCSRVAGWPSGRFQNDCKRGGGGGEGKRDGEMILAEVGGDSGGALHLAPWTQSPFPTLLAASLPSGEEGSFRHKLPFGVTDLTYWGMLLTHTHTN